MDLDSFKKSLTGPAAPVGLSPCLIALWHDAKGHWEEAHELVQEEKGPDAAWVHAYLHRKEGDEGNAAYWYTRARKPVFKGDLAREWEELVEELLVRE